MVVISLIRRAHNAQERVNCEAILCIVARRTIVVLETIVRVNKPSHCLRRFFQPPYRIIDARSVSDMEFIYSIFRIIVLTVYCRAATDEFGYNVGQLPIKYINNTAQFTCFVSKTVYPVIWNKIDVNGLNEPVQIANGRQITINDTRFSVTVDKKGLIYTLTIKDIKVSDNGFYQCVVVPGYEAPLSSVLELEVPDPPTIFDITIRSLVFKEGEQMILGCYARGHPIPVVTWTRENNAYLSPGVLSYSGNVLNIQNITKKDRGIYYCTAENGIGSPDRRNIGIEVEFSPVFINPIHDYWQDLQSEVEILCDVEAFPPPVIIWLKEKARLLNDQHYKITEIATVRKTIISKVHIVNIERKHYGNYTCRAANEFGTVDNIIHFNEPERFNT